MSKRKGVSTEEKRLRILQIFHEKKDFFQLRELEKIAPKEKGIIPQSVKDVVQSLVDDGLVDTDKIGSSIYFWAYPSKVQHMKKRKLEEIEKKNHELNEKLNCINEALEKAKEDRQVCKDREMKLKRIKELQEAQHELETKLKVYSDSDPKIVEALKNDIKKAKDAANRWTDNLYVVKSWCKNKFMIDGNLLDKQFGIPTDLDYVD